jgi:hypothetical protein
MAIGPESRRMASGRIVVVAVVQGALGTAAVLVGLGPLMQPAEPVEEAVAVVAIGLGCVSIVAGITLGLRLRAARGLGIAGGVATVLLGLILAELTRSSLEDCQTRGEAAGPCIGVLAAVGVLSAAIVAVGIAAIIVIRRAHPGAFRRHGRRGIGS